LPSKKNEKMRSYRFSPGFFVEPEVKGLVCEVCNATFAEREKLEEHRREKYMRPKENELQK
jgi:hypothetical protein